MLLSDAQHTNLLAALGERGLSPGKALGVVKLVTPGLVFDSNGKPTNLGAAVEAASQTWGDIFGRDTPDATVDEIQAARDAGITPERYEALKTVHNITDWEALERSGGAAA
jgi:hypothetical protein